MTDGYLMPSLDAICDHIARFDLSTELVCVTVDGTGVDVLLGQSDRAALGARQDLSGARCMA